MNYLTDDTLSYLIGTILDNNECFGLSSFLVCRRIKLLSDIVINNKLRTNYKILIKNNYLNCPLRSYYHIHKIYGCNFTLDSDKLQNLICLIIFNNNIELIEVICKTMTNSIKHIKDKLRENCYINLNGQYYINHDIWLWDIYIKTSDQYTKMGSYISRNYNNEFIKFKELISNFIK